MNNQMDEKETSPKLSQNTTISRANLASTTTRRINSVVNSSCKPTKSMLGVRSMKPTNYIKASRKRTLI